MARNPFNPLEADDELRKAVLRESGVGSDVLDAETVTPDGSPLTIYTPEPSVTRTPLIPRSDVAPEPEVPAVDAGEPPPSLGFSSGYSSKGDRVREALYAAGTGQKLSPEFFSRSAKEAAAEEQRRILREQVLAKWGERKLKAELERRRGDPDSEETTRALALFGATPEGKAWIDAAKANSPGIRLTAKDLPEWKNALPYFVGARKIAEAPALEEKKGEVKKDVEEVKIKGALAKQDDQQAFLGPEWEKDRASRERAAAARNELAKTKYGTQQADKDLMTEIPGYEKTGEVMVKPEVAEKMRGRVAGKDRIAAGTDKLKKIIDSDPLKFRSGAWLTDTKARADVITAFNSIKMGVKMNEDLGALVGGDFKLIEEAAVDPRNPMEVLKNLIGQSAFRDQLNSYPATVRELTDNELRLRGYRPKGSGQAAPAQPPTPAKPASMTTANGDIYDLDPVSGKYKKRAK